MSNLKKKVDQLTEKAAYLASAAPKVAEAHARKAVGDQASPEIVEFRKSQCESCVLYNLNKETGSANCNDRKFAADDDTTLDLEFVRKAGYPIIKEYGVPVATMMGIKRYILGCGCSMSGDNAKYIFTFREALLEKTDGTGPCPRGRWSKNKYEKWKTTKTKKS